MAQTGPSNDDAPDQRLFDDERGYPLLFAIHNCQEKDRIRTLIEVRRREKLRRANTRQTHGGQVRVWNAQNLHARLAPNQIGAQEPGMVKFEWVEDCIQANRLLPKDGYIITDRVAQGVKRKAYVVF